MAQAHNRGLARLLQAIDERWWLRHGLFWLVCVALMVLLFLRVLQSTTYPWRALRDAVLLVSVPFMLATYALLYGVLPLLWRDGRRGSFLARLAGWFAGSLALTFAFRYWVLVPLHRNEFSPFPDGHVVFATGAHTPLLLVAGAAACLKVYRQWRQKELVNLQLTQQNYQAELQLLKAQIHPHFLFNTLNNLYALTLRQADEAPGVVERLSRLLRFVVEQGTAPLVTLPEEVALLRDYIALEQLRYGPRLRLEFAADNIPATGRIAPLLLLPLVENAFKHGSAEQLGQAHIRIGLAVAGSTFSCVIENTKNAAGADEAAPPPVAGIGLRNVRQRLALLYPQRHTLEVEARDDTFRVRLTLQLPDAPAAEAAPVPQARPAADRAAEPARFQSPLPAFRP
ncbi:histidine kinase [Hymenobacter sp.]|uniref:sensor histidine kinase n=1 Tax=Hymenobacter sp. TaxID=1898978 RepID=UPI00286CF04D|nr:histidine kinase [Hymenobacter sp.]